MTLHMRSQQSRFLSSLEQIEHGCLRLVTPEGQTLRFGTGGVEVELALRDWRLIDRLAARGDIGLGEGWIDGDWHSSSLEALLTLFQNNRDRLPVRAGAAGLRALRLGMTGRFAGFGAPRSAPREIRAMFDQGNEFYHLWLDAGMSGSSALFGADDDLERAQARKNARIMSRLGPGETLLEIGCGWGSFAEAAADRGLRVTGLTLSSAQKGYADARLDGRAEIRLQDYRQTLGKFDNIVSIEMIETLGQRSWPGFFATLKARLAQGGRAVLQLATLPDAEFSVYRQRPDFGTHYARKGAALPCLAVMSREALRAGLVLHDSFSFGQDYARTCRIWLDRMLGERRRILRLGHQDRLLRGWQFHLAGLAAAFSAGRSDVMQVEFRHQATGI